MVPHSHIVHHFFSQSGCRFARCCDIPGFWDHSRFDWVTTFQGTEAQLGAFVSVFRPPPDPAPCSSCGLSDTVFFQEWTSAGFPMQCPHCLYWLRDASSVSRHLLQPSECSQLIRTLSTLNSRIRSHALPRLDAHYLGNTLQELATLSELKFRFLCDYRFHSPQLCPHCHVLFATIGDLQWHFFRMGRGYSPEVVTRFDYHVAGRLWPLALELPLLSYTDHCFLGELDQPSRVDFHRRRTVRARWIRITYALSLHAHNAVFALKKALQLPLLRQLLVEQFLLNEVLKYCYGPPFSSLLRRWLLAP